MVALVGVVIGILTNIGTSLIDGEAVWPYQWWIWGGVIGFAMLGVWLAVRAHRASTGDGESAGTTYDYSSHEDNSTHTTHIHHAPVPSSAKLVVPAGKVVLGEVPGEPPGWVQRGEQDDLAAQVAATGRVVVCAGGRGVGKSALAGPIPETRSPTRPGRG